MADGNLGSLWMSLGLKETISKDLKKLQQEFSGTDEKAKKVQNTIKEIESALKKPTDTNAISGAFSKLTALLEKSKTDAKDLAVVLKSLNAKDVLSIFDGKITATNAKSYLDMINKIREAINGLGRAPGENTFNLSIDLNKAADYLSKITAIKEKIKYVGDYAKSLGKDSAWLGMFDNVSLSLKRLRSNMLSALNDGSWNKRNDEFSKEYSKILKYLLGNINEINQSSSESQRKVAETATVATDSLKKEEEQAKKTAEAVASIGEKRKPAVMKESQQEAAFNKDVSKMTTANEAMNIKQKADGAKEAVVKLKYELNEVLNAFRGAASKKLGIDEAGEKGRQYVDILNQINKKVEEWKRKEGGEANASLIDQMAKNALSYLRLLQRIDNAERSIQEKRSANPNVDASRFKEASNVIAHFKEQLKGLEDSKFLTGVDSANVLGRYAQTWTMTLGQVNEIIGKFQKRNPLSDLDSNFSKIDAKIDGFREKLAKLRDLMSEGTSKGFKTSMLTDRITGMSGIVAQMEKAMANDGKVLSNADRMKQLFSDMQVEMSKTTAAFQAYGREKGKVIAQEREHNRVINESNSIQSGDNKRIKALTEIEFLLRDIQNLEGKSAGLGVNSTTLQTIRSEVESIKGVLGGLSGRDLMGQQLKNALDKLSEIKIRAREAMKEIGVENKSSETRKRLKDETESIVSNLSRQRRAFEENAEIRRKFSREITSLYEFTSGALNSKAFNPSDYLSQKIAEKKRELDNYINSADRVKKEIVNLGNEIKDLQNKIHGLSPTFDGKDAFGGLLSGDKLTKYNDLLDRLKSTVNSQDLLKESLDSEKLYSANVKSFEREIDQLNKLKDRAKEFDGRNAIELKNEIIQKNKELLQSEKQYSKELSAAEKQRQSELEISRRRIQSMEKALSNLQEKRFTSKMLGLDTSEAEAKIFNLKNQLSQLWELESKLSAKDMTAVGKLGNIGNGREVQAANDLARSYDRANKEAQKGIDLEEKRQAEIAKSAAKARNDLAAAFAGANAEAKKMQSIVSDIKSLFLQGGLVFGAQQFFNSIVQTGGEIVQQHIALKSILGDAEKANELFEQTKQLALQSPFKFGELNRDVKQLAAFGVEANDLYDTTKRLADIASGLGVSFERLGLAYGQVKSRSWLDGKELRQFAYAGLPLLQRITEMYNATGKNGRTDYSEADVKEMISKRQVSFDDVQKVLWNMTDEGGQFYNMQFVLSDTLLGRWNKLIDAWDIMLGKFAEGKNVVGGTFAFMINRVTDLVLALDKLSPVLLSMGAVFAAKKLGGYLGGNALKDRYSKAVAQQLRSYAIEQQQLVIEGKISQEKARQNILKRQDFLTEQKAMMASYSRLALEGKMSVLQMQRAVKEGLIGEELVKQLATMGMITQRQAQIIINGGKMAAVMSMAGSKIKGIFSALGGWWGIGLAALAEGISFIAGEWNAVEDKANELRGSQSGKIDSYNEMLGKSAPEDSAEMQKRVDEMKKLLADSGAYTKTLQEQVEKAKDLREQYELLRKGITAAKENSYADADIVASAILNSGGWRTGLPGSDNIQENIEDLNDEMSKYKSILSSFDAVSRDVMNNVANSMLGPKYAAKSLEDKLLDIQRNKSMEVFYAKVRASGVRINGSLYSISDAAFDVMSDIKKIADTNVPNAIHDIQKSVGKFGDDFRRFCKDQPARFRDMLTAMADDATWLVPEINKKLYELTGYKFTAGKDPKDTALSSIQRQIYGRLGGNDKMYALLKPYIDDKSLYKTNNNLQQALTDLYNEKRAQEKIGNKNSASAKSYDELWTATYKGTGYKYIPEDKKSNKVPKQRERSEDKELEKWQERLSSYKSARQVYQNYSKLPGWTKEKAKKYVESLYTNIIGLNLDNYEEAMKTLEKSLDFKKTPARKKALTSLKREMADWDYSENKKPSAEDLASDNKEAMSKLAERLDLQKELVEKTGDKNFGDMVWGYNIIVDDKARTLMDEYYAQYGKLFGAGEALSMTESQAKKAYTGAGEFEAWQTITNLLRGNYYNALRKSADVIKEHLSDEEKIVATRARYNELIKNAEKAGNKRAVTAYRQDLRKEVGKLELNKYKSGEDYLNFYGAIVSIGTAKAKKIADDIKKNMNRALQDGAVEAKEYTDELVKLEEQLEKLSKVQPSFANGGLSGIIERKKSQGKEQIEQGSNKYQQFKKMYDIHQQFGNGEGMIGAQSGMNAGQSMMEGGQALMEGAGEMEGAIAIIDTIIHGINDIVQGLNDTFHDLKETAEALGKDTDTDGWNDANTFFSGFSSASASATKGWDSLKNGDIGGVISGVTGSFTGWIKAFAAGHDAKLDHQIKLAERQVKELQNISSNISTAIEKGLGGIYNYTRSDETQSKLNEIKASYENTQRQKEKEKKYGAPFKVKSSKQSAYSDDTYEYVKKADAQQSAYSDQLALLKAQRDELKKQQESEAAKKNSDEDKLLDYKQQIAEMQTSIDSFAQDFLKNVYSIDMKSWASELTDAVVSAWENGEDAVDAYQKKVKDMVKNVTKNIISQKIVETAMKKPMEYLTGILEEKGKLDETDVTNFAQMVNSAGENVVPQLTAVFENLKDIGWDVRDSNGSSSTTNSVKSITEEKGDIIASYLNAIRLDVSVNRENIKQIADAVTGLPELNVIAQSQLAAMNQLVSLAQYRNSKLDDMYSWMRSVTSGTGTKSISMK